jgi:predicted RNA-binding protein with PIN domain
LISNEAQGAAVTWYLIVFTLRMLAVQNGTGTVQIVKFTDAQACQSAQTQTNTDGIATVCTSSLKDADGFIAAMGCQDSHMSQLPNGVTVARFSCAPQITVAK